MTDGARRGTVVIERVESAVLRVLERGYRTADIRQEGTSLVGTRQMGDLIAQEVDALY